jgi:transposase
MEWPAPAAADRVALPEHAGRSMPGKERAMALAIVGIDPGKNGRGVAALDGSGGVALRRLVAGEAGRVRAQAAACIVAMAACCGAHRLGRVFEAQGHAVRPMSPEQVQPHAKARKNEDRGGAAIAEAAARPAMRFAEIEEEARLDMRHGKRPPARRPRMVRNPALINTDTQRTLGRDSPLPCPRVSASLGLIGQLG